MTGILTMNWHPTGDAIAAAKVQALTEQSHAVHLGPITVLVRRDLADDLADALIRLGQELHLLVDSELAAEGARRAVAEHGLREARQSLAEGLASA